MPQTHPFFDTTGPIAMAHRGFSLSGLENSMAAFAAAIDLGYRYVETDVHATSDGTVVAFHDATLDRVADGPGVIARLPWHVVRRARIGGLEPVPTLAELLDTWPDLRVNIDVKAPGAVGPLVDVIEGTRSHARICIASFSDRRRRAVLRRLSAPTATSGGYGTACAFRAACVARSAALVRTSLRGVDCLQLPEAFGGVPVVTARTLAAAHAAGTQVHVWTVNEPARMHRLLDLGVDGIVTDRADLLREALLARGAWPA